MIKFLWKFSNLSSKLWYSASLYGLVAVITALMAVYLKRFIPTGLTQQIGADAVDNILNILAASMLSVTIFSLSTMVASYSSVTNNATPRATKLLIEDKISHRALSTFLGTFIFSIVGIIALKMGIYGDSGRLILFIVTIGVVVMIIITLLSWIEYLARLGRLDETTHKVELATEDALEKRIKVPFLGGSPLKNKNKIPAKALSIKAGMTGYVQHIDMPQLSRIATKHEAKIYVVALPGKFISDNIHLAYILKKVDESVLEEIQSAFIIDNSRSFRQDPRFGLVVLAEIASRALSPATNDPGTAIQVIGTVVRILLTWSKKEEHNQTDEDIPYPLVYVPPLKIEDLFEDFFLPVSRDGASILEVNIRLQQAYNAFMQTNNKELIKEAEKYKKISLERAQEALSSAYDKKALKKHIQHLEKMSLHPK